MGLTVRMGAISAGFGFVLIALAGWVGGCALGGKPGTTNPATTQASTKPVHETVTVELNEQLVDFAPRARGVLRPKPSAQLPPELLSPLGKLAEGRDGRKPPVLITLGDVVKYDGAFPGEKGKWTKWDAGVLEELGKLRSEGRPIILELWKEPDRPPFKDRLDFFSAWVHTVKLIRGGGSPWPDVTLMGPGISKNDGGWVQEFLKVSKEWGVLPAIVSWHEDGLKHDISGHVGGMMNNFWQDGLNRDAILVSPNAAVESKYAASDPPIFMGQMEKSAKDNGWQPVAQWFAFKMTHLFTADLKPRSLYYSYKAYADLAATPSRKSVKVSESQTVGGVAVWEAKGRTGRLLLGRNRSRVDAKHVLGDVALQVKGAVGAEVVVRVSRIADTGTKASTGPTAAVAGVYPVRNGEARVPLEGFASGDALVVELTVRGTPVVATTRSAVTTRSTTTNATTKP